MQAKFGTADMTLARLLLKLKNFLRLSGKETPSSSTPELNVTNAKANLTIASERSVFFASTCISLRRSSLDKLSRKSCF